MPGVSKTGNEKDGKGKTGKGKNRKGLRYYMLTSYMEKVRKGKQGNGQGDGAEVNGNKILEQYFQRVVDCDVILNCRRCNRELRTQCPIFYGKSVSERNFIKKIKSGSTGTLSMPEYEKAPRYRRTCAVMQLTWILDKTKRWKKVEID